MCIRDSANSDRTVTSWKPRRQESVHMCSQIAYEFMGADLEIDALPSTLKRTVLPRTVLPLPYLPSYNIIPFLEFGLVGGGGGFGHLRFIQNRKQVKTNQYYNYKANEKCVVNSALL